MPDGEAREAFVRETRLALQSLYNPARLRRSPLLAALALEKRCDPVSALRQALLEAIHALKPGRDVPPQANAWRIYHVLTYRYVEQSEQLVVAANLGLSERQLRRAERVAEEVLADALWARYDLSSRTSELALLLLQGEGRGGAPGVSTPAREQELEWMRASFPSESADLGGMLRTALSTIGPLTQDSGVQVELEVAEDLPPVSGQLSAIRQALLNLLTAAIHSAPGGQVRVQAAGDLRGVRVSLRATPGGDGSASPGRDAAEETEMARQFARLFDGSLEVTGAPFVATLHLRVSEQVPVLVVDDNADTLRLLQRYLLGTRYRFIGARDPQQALSLAEECAPQIIVLDVMLPGTGDWELLSLMRQHSAMFAVPIIVCTILPQERLALALGADAFVRKPVSRQQLLSALDRQIERISTGSR